MKTTNIAIALAAPLEAPVINVDVKMNDFYMLMHYEWENFSNTNEGLNNKKILLSFGNGPRDVLMPSGLTASNDSYINALVSVEENGYSGLVLRSLFSDSSFTPLYM